MAVLANFEIIIPDSSAFPQVWHGYELEFHVHLHFKPI